MSSFLKTPHPIGFGWAYALVPALAVLFILIFLEPYGFDEMPFDKRWPRALPFGIITAIAAPLNLWLARMCLPGIIDEDHWTISHEFIYNVYDILLIGLWNTLFLYLTRPPDKAIVEFLFRIESHTFLIGIIPIIALMAYKHNEALSRQLKQARAINNELQKSVVADSSSNPISLFSENNKLEIKLLADQILYIKAARNYLEIFYTDQKDLQRQLIRNRLKVLQESLPQEQFLACHKSYIVNIHKIVRVEGNARDMKLFLRGVNEPIPVSRNKGTTLLQQLKTS